MTGKSNDKHLEHYVRFEVFTAVTVRNGVFWDVTPYVLEDTILHLEH
jgi:hypothetical protein